MTNTLTASEMNEFRLTHKYRYMGIWENAARAALTGIADMDQSPEVIAQRCWDLADAFVLAMHKREILEGKA